MVTHIASFLTANPHFFVSLEVNTSDEVIRGILDDRFDLGLTGVELSRDGVKLLPYRISNAVCVMTSNHPLAKRETIHPVDLNDQQFIALTYRHARRTQLDKILSQSRSAPRIVA